MKRDRDILWKGIIEEVFDDLLRFIFPKADELFDLKRKFAFLDKELSQLYPEPEKPSATRVVDKLVQVYRRDGRPEWLLIHLEVQNSWERQFPERMFRYYYRIFDHLKRPVTAVAILTGKDGHRIKDRYEYKFIGTELTYKYNVLRIGKYKEEDLARNPNPFAAVALFAKKALLSGKIPEEELLAHKKELAAELLARKDLPRRKRAAMLSFLNNYIVFEKPKTNRNFIEHLAQLKEKRDSMNMFEAVAEVKMMDARAEGLQEGLEKSVRVLLADTELSVAKIASKVGLPVTFVKKLSKEVRAKNR